MDPKKLLNSSLALLIDLETLFASSGVSVKIDKNLSRPPPEETNSSITFSILPMVFEKSVRTPLTILCNFS